MRYEIPVSKLKVVLELLGAVSERTRKERGHEARAVLVAEKSGRTDDDGGHHVQLWQQDIEAHEIWKLGATTTVAVGSTSSYSPVEHGPSWSASERLYERSPLTVWLG